MQNEKADLLIAEHKRRMGDGLKAVGGLRDAFSPVLFTLRDKALRELADCRENNRQPNLSVAPQVKLLLDDNRSIFNFTLSETFKRIVTVRHLPTSFELTAGVGSYGDNLSIALVRSAIFLTDMVGSDLKAECARLPSEHPSVIPSETFRSNPALTIGEGIQTMCYVFGVIAGDTVVGVENEKDLLMQIQKSDLLTKMSLRAPLAFFGPAQQKNVRFSGPVEMKDGKLVISDHLEALFNKEKSLFKDYVSSPRMRFLGCPVAHRAPGLPESGIKALSEAFIVSTNYFLDTPSRGPMVDLVWE